ncbi:metalloregulator ArsR/SmtB family transcription factor [Cohnella sp. AR92]|uniref:helix-turn-helix transcriptional regulator n=1 Tax=Cohnella sp. AR92 TaxID=648716 RepID=UPI000F8C42C2|nr:metalloregulator ArsR/SmtB family transcription factor [Cohnella sp. AR92]RUS48676.1 transcriptional regulator [Cohnella sp. AR92]
MPQAEEGTTRSQLVQMLRTRGSSSIAELARPLGITEMAVRRHIHSLEKDGLVSSSLLKQAMGRPSYRYRLTERADELFPKNYPHLTLELLGELEEVSGEAIIGQLFEGRKRKLEAKYKDRMENKGLEEKVAELAGIQNAGGYMAEWEAAGDGSYRLHEYNCPIAQVANRYREACRCEKRLFGDLLDADVERTECLADGGMRCTYLIRAAKG